MMFARQRLFILAFASAFLLAPARPAEGADYTTERKDTLKLPDKVFKIAFSPDSKTLAVVCWRSSDVSFWSVATGKELCTLSTDLEITCMAFAEEGKSLIVTGAKKEDGKQVFRLAVWDLEKRELKRTTEVRGTAYEAISADGRTVALPGWDSENPGVDLWDPLAGKRLAHLKADHDPIILAFSPNGKFLAGGCDGELRAWDVGKRKEIARLPVKGRQYALAPASDGKTLAACTEFTEEIKVFDLQKQVLLDTCDAYCAYDHALAASADGALLATCSAGRLYLIESDSRKWRHTRSANDKRITQVLFSPDGKTLATAGEDETVCLFEVICKK
jgi:WD40 repeat protein